MKRQVKRLLTAFRRDTRGAVSGMSLILVTFFVGIGAIVGLVIIRDHLIQEFGDVAVGLDNMDQSFSYMIDIDGDGDGFMLADPDDTRIEASYTDDAATLMDVSGQPPTCLMFGQPPVREGNLIQEPTGNIP